MYNCHKIFVNDRLFAIVHTRDKAEFILKLLDEAGLIYSSSIEGAFVEGIGF